MRGLLFAVLLAACGGVVEPAADACIEHPWWPDPDGDGHGSEGAEPVYACERPPGHVDNADDCAHLDPARFTCR